MSHSIIFVEADDLDEVAELLDPYDGDMFDFWESPGRNTDFFTDWDSKPIDPRQGYRTVEWFLDATKTIEKTWTVFQSAAEKVTGRTCEKEGFELIGEEFSTLVQDIRTNYRNMSGRLHENGVMLGGVFSTNNICITEKGILVPKPVLFKGFSLMGSGDGWDEMESDAEGLDRIRNCPTQNKIWLIDYHS